MILKMIIVLSQKAGSLHDFLLSKDWIREKEFSLQQ